MSSAGIREIKCATFEDFLEAISRSPSIRVVKLDDRGFTAPIEKDGAIILQPMIRIVATAFHKASMNLYRWEETKEARLAVGPSSPAGNGTVSEGATLLEKERIRQRLQLEGFSVDKGEWTPATIQMILGKTGS